MAYDIVQMDATESNVLPYGKAATALVTGDLVYMTSTGTWAKADQTAVGTAAGSTKDAIGVCWKGVQASEGLSPVRVAIVRGFTGLTIGGKVYLSDTAGDYTQTEPTTNRRQVVGFASSATEVVVAVGGASGAALDEGGDLTVDTLTASGVTTTTLAATTSVTVTSASASALTVGLAGATNPVLKVNASTALQATGVSITGAAAAGGVAVAVISSGTNEDLTIDAKGSGTVTINGTATGGITLGTTVTMADAADIALDTTTGTTIATAVGQKLGFWGATPVVQPASADQADQGAMTAASPGDTEATSGGWGASSEVLYDALNTSVINLVTDVAALDTLLTEIRTALVNTGIIKGAA